MSHPKQAARSKREVRMCVCVRSFVVCLSCAFPPKSNAGGGGAPAAGERARRKACRFRRLLLACLAFDRCEGGRRAAGTVPLRLARVTA